MTDEEFTTEEWLYQGRRLSRERKIVYAWHSLVGDHTYFFTKVAGQVIGGVYEIPVKRTADEIYVRGAPTFLRLSEHDTDEDRSVWQAQDRDAKAKQDAAAWEKRMAKTGGLDEALAPLLAVAAKCRTAAEVEALVAATSRAIWKAF